LRGPEYSGKWETTRKLTQSQEGRVVEGGKKSGTSRIVSRIVSISQKKKNRGDRTNNFFGGMRGVKRE